jgi:hypothetical protein
MKKLKSLLPQVLLQNIWEYDDTYHITFKLVLLELQFVTCYWKCQTFVKKTNNIYNLQMITRSGHREWQYYNNCKNLTYYWNNEHQMVYNSKYYKFMVSLFDIKSEQYHKVFKNIKELKYLLTKIRFNEHNLKNPIFTKKEFFMNHMNIKTETNKLWRNKIVEQGGFHKIIQN